MHKNEVLNGDGETQARAGWQEAFINAGSLTENSMLMPDFSNNFDTEEWTLIDSSIMEIQENIINKVANSGLVTLNLEEYFHNGERVVYDIKDNLFHGLILKEQDFRAFIKEHDWSQYQGKNIAIICSADAIVPTWAYMLLSNKMKPYANEVVFGSLETLEAILFTKALATIDLSAFAGARVVVKGCADIDVPVSAYVEITALLTPVAKSIMYGEPCSTVPIFKRKD